MSSSRPLPVRGAAALGVAAAMVVTLLSAISTSAAGPAGVSSAVASGEPDGKQGALSRAERVATSAVGRAQAIAAGRESGDLTMALREVANSRLALTGAERAEAEALLRRPTDTGGDGIGLDYGAEPVKRRCTADICVHFVEDGRNATTPSFVDAALATLTRIHDAYLRAGYREPRADRGRGGNDLIDIYLGDIGSRGIYGYCTSDQPEPDPTPSTFDRWAYCTLDNDFRADQFPTNTPLENLQVTAAHEYFHATQYAYDRYEDAWLLEATAAWVEDEMYDGVDDNLQYLPRSQLRQPRVPLDTFNPRTGFHYGTWSYFRFLTERYPQRQGPLPRLVLDVFRKADGARGGPDQYSWQAVDSVLRAKGTTGAKMLGAYAVANRRPAIRYAEGRANRYPVAPLARRATITPRNRARVEVRLDHLSTATARLTPQGLGAARWKLRLAFDLAPRVTSASALVTTATRAGRVSTQRVFLDRRGNGAKRIPFSSSTVAWVEVTLVNGSGRFRCFTGGAFSCGG